MGKTSKPTKILVHPSLLEWDEIKDLQAQGHQVQAYDMDEFDLILGPQCWNMDESLKPNLLSLALPAARKRVDARRTRST